MSRLRRLALSDRWFFITCRVLPGRRILSDSEFAILARVIRERREEHGFLLTAWVFLPNHWHAIFYPRCHENGCAEGTLECGSVSYRLAVEN